jgi:hypothetical protein
MRRAIKPVLISLCAALVLTALSACSTKTLLTINVDADSFVTAKDRTGSLPIGVGGALDYRFPDDDGDTVANNDLNGVSVSLTSLKVLEAAKLSVTISLDTSATGGLELFIAPNDTVNIYQPQYRVLQSTNTTGQDFKADASLSANSSDPAKAQAFTAIQSGTFRIGAHLQGTAAPGSSIAYTLKDISVSASGYPIKAF